MLGRDELGAMFRLFDVTNKGSVTVDQANAVRNADTPSECATQAATGPPQIPFAIRQWPQLASQRKHRTAAVAAGPLWSAHTYLPQSSVYWMHGTAWPEPTKLRCYILQRAADKCLPFECRDSRHC